MNDYDDVGKLKAKEDIRVFVGYSKESAAFRIYNKRTRKIHESVNVNFDEISEMASKQFSLELSLSNLNETRKSSNPSVSQVSETLKKVLEDLFHNFYDEYFDSSKIMKSSTMNCETLLALLFSEAGVIHVRRANQAGEGYHAVPPLYTRNFMPPRPDLSFAGLADSVFKSVISETITSVHETETNWESDSDDDCDIRPLIEQNKPSHAKINFAKSDENTRKSVIESHTYKQAENLGNSQNCRVDKRDWNGMMTQKLGD
nr:retrovirus-related Pol polyprotein from transposon TNT 1-94 [Tanacetum cinerariifolium]